MAQAALATRADFYRHGLPEESFAPAERAITAVDVSANVLSLRALAPAAGTPVRLKSTGTLPAPLSSTTVYYALAVADADDLLQLATTAGGAAVNITDAGSANATHAIVVQVGPIIDAGLLATSQRWAQAMIAHGGEIAYDDCPAHIRQGICEEFAGKIVTTRGLMRAGFADEHIHSRAKDARAQRAMYERGTPVRGLVDATPDVADNGAVHEVLGGPVPLEPWDGLV